MDVSLILATCNNSARLEKTLAAISHCAIPPGLRWELVLVANGCTDRTSEVVERACGQLPIIHVEVGRPGLSEARNRGLAAARGRLIIFTDDDVKPCGEWLVAYWAAYREKSTGFFFGGPLEVEYEGPKPERALLACATPSIAGLSFGEKARALNTGEKFLGANWSCPAEDLRRAGGFDPRLGLDASLGRMRVGEEYCLMQNLMKNDIMPWYVPQARLVHVLPEEKCGLSYVGSKAEAQGIYAVCANHGLDPSHYRFLGVDLGRLAATGAQLTATRFPWRLYSKTTSSWGRWRWASLMGRNGYLEHTRYRFCLGVLRGVLEKRRQAGAPHLSPSNADSSASSE